MRMAVCDDSALDSLHLKPLLQRYGAEHPEILLTVDWFSAPDGLLEAGASYDLYLLDILLGQTTGIELAQALRARGEEADILFLTSSPDFALSAFSVHAADYLLKPVAENALFAALGRAAEAWQRRRREARQHTFSFRAPDGLNTVTVEQILYIEILGHTPYFHLEDRAVRGSELRIPFEEAMTPLLRMGCFLHPHRSYFVSAAHIVSLTPQSVRLSNGETIPVVRTRSAEVKAQYLDYLLAEGRTV